MWIGDLGQAALRLLLAVLVLSMAWHGWTVARPTTNRVRVGRTLVLMQFALAALASAALVDLLVSENLAYTYVAEYTGPHLPLIYRIAAFWGGNAGSLLFWMFILTVYGSVLAAIRQDGEQRVVPLALCISNGITLFYGLLLVFVANPFERLPHPAAVGNNLNPLLQNPGMTVHPVNVYLGCIGFTVPYAYAMACVWLKQTDDAWLRVTRRWSMVAWLFLGIGIVYGAHWSYEELGWGGYWAWDPVENASLLPWLTATAFLHTAMAQERRGLFSLWNIVLITLTFVLTLFGTFLTRSGTVWSIHAFADGPLGVYYLTFIGLVVAFSVATILLRGGSMRSGRRLQAVVSRESGFLLNNLLLLAVMFAVLWGTVYPLVSQLLVGRQMVVSASFYNDVALPVAVVILALMAVGSRIAWGKSSVTEVVRSSLGSGLVALAAAGVYTLWMYMAYGRLSWLAAAAMLTAGWVMASVLSEWLAALRRRMAETGDGLGRSVYAVIANHRRRWGGYCVHLAFAVMAVGVVGSGAYHLERQQVLAPGQTAVIGAYQLTFADIAVKPGEGTRQMYADLVVSQEGRTLGVLCPAVTFYADGQQPLTNVAIYSRPLADLYVVMIGTSGGTRAVFDFHLNPLVSWIWWGGYLMIFGTLFSLWPTRVGARLGTAARWSGLASGQGVDVRDASTS
ncbi:heme lyase CcmF/NrfE family subunit [Alicyclobacillus shizuokensis]|uniref:heme lyase CcmF/NrfE family subunit n=1 Tax=Alicyclobacillus shizuokensis TaxID=392014 RepID=UPI000835B538|nr:cytochrome c-type biogenesis CcmF C-terminal domain-containing protein [Alicyclobacillus shizuokensis]MCL6625571.1 cytochrome c biogenesis protein CcsA [Alicyclobacillus shizuokensis]